MSGVAPTNITVYLLGEQRNSIRKQPMRTESLALDELLQRLPPDAHAKVRDFAEFLLEKRNRGPGQPLRQGWAGALSEYREQYTSTELERKALEWRGD